MTISSKNSSSALVSGFLLTRQAYDTKQGIALSFWLKTEMGAVNVVVEEQSALFFVENEQVGQVKQLFSELQVGYQKITPLELKTFNQQAVSGIYFSKMRDFYRAKELLKLENIKCYEDDFRPDDRYLMERFVTASAQFNVAEQQTLNNSKRKHQFPLYQAKQCRAIPASDTLDKLTLSMVSLDIECSMQGHLYSIGLYSHDLNGKPLKTILMIGDQKATFDAISTSKLAVDEAEEVANNIVWLVDEKELLQCLITWIHDNNPDIIIGWNVVQFDFNLLQKRCDLHHIPFVIGRDGKAPRWRKNQNTEQHYIDIAGRVVLDGIDLMKSATYNFSSFSLDFVANALLGKGKKVDDVENRVKEITDNFNHDKLALAAYNLEDCRLVTLIFEHTQLLEFAMLRAQLTGLNIDRVGGSVAAFTNLYLPKLHRAGYVAPNMGDGLQGLVSPGGYVMDSIPGLYKNVLVLDFKSLYPSIIRSFKIDPMGLIEGLKLPEQAIEGFDGAYFSRDKHFLPAIIEALWQERDKAKLEKNSILSQAIKIIMNSFYGVLGSTGCRFFDPRLSGSITKRSHALLKTTKIWIEDKGYQVIYGDTDSIFVHVGDDKTVEQCQDLGVELQQFINEKWQSKLQADFAIESQLEIEFETHFTQFFMPTIRGQEVVKDLKSVGTKKRYAGLVNDKLVFKGLETVRSDWTAISKTFQQELYRLIFNGEPVEDYIKSLVSEIKSGLHDNNLIYMKKLRRNIEDYVNTPPHIKAAIIANNRLEKKGLKAKYRRGSRIEYVITIDGVQPMELAVSALDYDFYIDRQIKPIADDILPFIGTSFDNITSSQLGLF